MVAGQLWISAFCLVLMAIYPPSHSMYCTRLVSLLSRQHQKYTVFFSTLFLPRRSSRLTLGSTRATSFLWQLPPGSAIRLKMWYTRHVSSYRCRVFHWHVPRASFV